MKSSYITPVYKDGDPQDVSRYRPISILSAIQKLFEYLVLTNKTTNCCDITSHHTRTTRLHWRKINSHQSYHIHSFSRRFIVIRRTGRCYLQRPVKRIFLCQSCQIAWKIIQHGHSSQIVKIYRVISNREDRKSQNKSSHRSWRFSYIRCSSGFTFRSNTVHDFY